MHLSDEFLKSKKCPQCEDAEDNNRIQLIDNFKIKLNQLSIVISLTITSKYDAEERESIRIFGFIDKAIMLFYFKLMISEDIRSNVIVTLMFVSNIEEFQLKISHIFIKIVNR